jgi:predicted enzyme related to lactoylglutathione lyase
MSPTISPFFAESATLFRMHPQPLICVADVEASSRWYQRLLGLSSAHGGKAYEQLTRDGELILQLHSFEVEHHHGAIGDREDRPYGNGVLLWFEVEDFDAIAQRAEEMNVEIVMPKHRNPPDDVNGGPNHWELWMRDPDGYRVVVASPYGTADGNWRPSGNLFA